MVDHVWMETDIGEGYYCTLCNPIPSRCFSLSLKRLYTFSTFLSISMGKYPDFTPEGILQSKLEHVRWRTALSGWSARCLQCSSISKTISAWMFPLSDPVQVKDQLSVRLPVRTGRYEVERQSKVEWWYNNILWLLWCCSDQVSRK